MHMKILKFRTFKEDLCRLLFRYSFDLFQRPSRTRDWLANIIHHLKRKQSYVYATDSTVLYPASVISLMSRGVNPLMPCSMSAWKEVRLSNIEAGTSSFERGVGAPGPPRPSSYPDCDSTSSALIVS